MSDLVDLGLWGLFLAALLAGSAVPLASEPVLAAVVVAGSNPTAAIVVATVGNVLGALTLYAMGWGFERGLLRGRLRRRFEADPERLAQAKQRMERWGTAALLLAWAPVIGDPLVLGAGLTNVRPVPFLILVTLGKAARYVVVAQAALAAAG